MSPVFLPLFFSKPTIPRKSVSLAKSQYFIYQPPRLYQREPRSPDKYTQVSQSIIMCQLESAILLPCECQAYKYEPTYCPAYRDAHPTPQRWYRTITSSNIAQQYSSRDFITDGTHYLTLSDPKKDPFPPLDCPRKEIQYFPQKFPDCPFHELMQEERKKKRFGEKIKKIGSWFWRNILQETDPNSRFAINH